jgi:hypothetical protein
VGRAGSCHDCTGGNHHAALNTHARHYHRIGPDKHTVADNHLAPGSRARAPVRVGGLMIRVQKDHTDPDAAVFTNIHTRTVIENASEVYSSTITYMQISAADDHFRSCQDRWRHVKTEELVGKGSSSPRQKMTSSN